MKHREAVALGVLLCLGVSCGGADTPAPASRPAAAQPAPAPEATPPPKPAIQLVANIEEAKAAEILGADFGRLLALAKLSPKTHKSLLSKYLFQAKNECPGTTFSEVQPAPGLIVAGKGLKLHERVNDGLKAAANVAKQRGLAIEVLAGQSTVKEVVREWNRAVIDAATKLVKAAKPAEQKERSFGRESKVAVGAEAAPSSWGADACESGRLGGWTVVVQLVTVDASGKRGQVLVKGGTDGDRFTKETFESIYWNKPKGKPFRTLTEIMSAGKFIRECSSAFTFTASAVQDGSWRCKQDGESWDPPNRPIPAWQ
jgi:hypothetical protein